MQHKSIVAICITVVLLLFITCTWNIAKIKLFTDAGYTRTTLPGESMAHWVKSDKGK
jgi:hypothetical protein